MRGGRPWTSPVGSLPVVVDETAEYGYMDENRHMVRGFLRRETLDLTFADGVEVVGLLMTAYVSAERGARCRSVPRGLRPSSRRGARGPCIGRGGREVRCWSTA